MALTAKQISELNVASQRIASGQGTDIDRKNVDYATKNFGYTYNPTSTLQANVPPAPSEINPAEGTQDVIRGLGTTSPLATFLQSTLNTAKTTTDQASVDLIGRLEAERKAKEEQATKDREAAALGLKEAQGESLESIYRRLSGEFKIDETRKQLADFKNQLVALEEAYTISQNEIGAKPIHNAIIRGQQFLKQQEFAAKAATINAKVAIVGEQYDLAMDTVKNMFNAAADDRAQKISNWERLYDLADKKIISLDAEERENINAMIQITKDAETRAKADKNKILDLLTKPEMANAFAKSGADLTMSYDQIVSKMIPQLSAQYQYELAHKYKSSSTTPTSELDKSVKEYALQAIQLEKYGTKAEKDAAFANVVNQLVKDSGGSMTYSTASTSLIRKMQELKGEAITYMGNQSDGSDLETPSIPSITSPTLPPNTGYTDVQQYKTRAAQLLRTISGLTGASPTEIAKARKELNGIPQYINGEKIY